MRRREYLRIVGTAAVGSAYAGCMNLLPPSEPQNIQSRVTEDGFQTKRDDGEWENHLIHGVNLGMGKPGRFPGEAAISKEEYKRWLTQIANMNANVIRVYTLHPPAFYEALAEHNADNDNPLLVLHGNWIAEKTLSEAGDAFDADVIEEHREGIQHIIDAVHGNLELPEQPGHASGRFRVDVSPYILGYIIGIEWNPKVVDATDNEYDDEVGEYNGTFIETEAASPFEHWLAARMDDVATYEYDQYESLRPLSFTNWPTTDHLDHPAEPHESEDLASITLNHISPTGKLDQGLFATYHVYPYYPEFLNYELDYVHYITENGEESSYRGYIEDLVSENEYPVLIGEFGVPSSRGKTHTHVHGFDQGGHTEEEQGEINVQLYEHIVKSGTLGGLVFTWQDEWFKRTWNTMDYMDPNRRPFWSDIQTCEQMFGVLSFDPRDETGITLSGNPEQWDHATRLNDDIVNRFSPVRLGDGNDDMRTLTGLKASADARYLYLQLTYENLGSEVDWSEMNTLVFLDLMSDQGNTTIPYNTGLETQSGIDFLVLLAGPDESRVIVDSYYDIFYYFYGELLEVIPLVDSIDEKDSGNFHKIKMALNNEIYIPSQDKTVEFESYETGKLRFGNGDPESAEFDSLTDVCITPEENMIELRLPWLLLNFGDPSQRELIDDFWKEDLKIGEYIGKEINDISITAATFKPTEDGEAVDLESTSNITDSFTPVNDGTLKFDSTSRFSWEKWDQPTYHERRKQSYYMLQKAFSEY